MEYQEFCEKFLRMCGHYNFCFECPLEDKYQEKGHRGCSAWCIAHPQKAEQILEQWAKEHPIVRNCDKLHEVFGNGFKMMMHDTFDVFISRNGKEIPMSEWMHQEYKEPKEDDNGND